MERRAVPEVGPVTGRGTEVAAALGPPTLADLLGAQGLSVPGGASLDPLDPPDGPPGRAGDGAASPVADWVADWARSGLMWLTGAPEGPPLAPAGPVLERARAAARAFDAFGPPAGGPVAREVEMLLGGRAALLGLGRRGTVSASGTCRLIRCADGWLALNLARPGDVDLVGALLERDLGRATGGASPETAAWAAVASAAPTRSTADLVGRAWLLGLPASVLPASVLPASAPPASAPSTWPTGAASSSSDPAGGEGRPGVRVHGLGQPRPGGPARQPLVVDLSALWAGPLCAHLLGRAGMRVVKVESVTRPDGARAGNSAFFDWLHAGHATVGLDFSSRAGRAALAALVGRADVVIESSRPRALAQLGIDARALVSARPGVTWVSITGYGRDAGDEAGGPGPVAFGDDAAVAGGLVAWDDRPAPASGAPGYGAPASGAAGYGAPASGAPIPGGPVFCADAIADPLTGLYAACAARASVAAGGGHLLDLAMARVAAHAGEPADPATARSRPVRARRYAPGAGGWCVDAAAGNVGNAGDAGREAAGPAAQPVPVTPPRAPTPRGRAAGLGADTRAVLGELGVSL